MIHSDLIQDFLNGELLVDFREDSHDTVDELLDQLALLGVVWCDGAPANAHGHYIEDFLYHRIRHDIKPNKQYLISSQILHNKLQIVGIPFYVCSAFELLENIQRGRSNKFCPVPLDLTSIFA